MLEEPKRNNKTELTYAGPSPEIHDRIDSSDCRNCRGPGTRGFKQLSRADLEQRAVKSWMCFTEKGCCQCIARLRKRAKPWRQGCPVGEWCRIRKLLRKQAKPTRQGRPVGAAMCRRGSQIPCASPQQSKVKMAPTRKCRTWSWDVSFSQNSQADLEQKAEKKARGTWSYSYQTK